MKDLNLQSIKAQFAPIGRKLRRYGGLGFFVLFAVVYAFVIMRISALSDVQVSDSDVASQVSATPMPRIDPRTISQLRSLNDNSVNVQTLFQQGRTNPFKE
jgi:hypothetical protein